MAHMRVLCVIFGLLVLVLTGCKKTCDPDTDESCEEFDPKLLDREDVICNGKICPINLCLVDSICVDNLWCSGSAQIPGIDDGNACTVDSCNPYVGVPIHTTIDIDDGDDCTYDDCDPFSGPTHEPICD